MVVVALTGEALACLSCGVQVDTAPEKISVTAAGRVGTPAPINPDVPIPQVREDFTRCRSCADREKAAGLILDDHPAISARLGRASARHRLACALDALAALGLPYPKTFPAQEVHALLRHLTVPGGFVRWSARFAPVTLAEARTGTAGTHPWSHVTEEQVRAVRDGYAALLADRAARNAPPVHLGPPEGEGGCLLCGLATVPVRPVRGGTEAARRRVWTPIKASRSSLGGRPTSDRLAGHTCPTCTEAVTTIGSIGAKAMERSLLAHLREQGLTAEADRVRAGETSGPVAWGAQPGRAPNETPWAHLMTG